MLLNSEHYSSAFLLLYNSGLLRLKVSELQSGERQVLEKRVEKLGAIQLSCSEVVV